MAEPVPDPAEVTLVQRCLAAEAELHLCRDGRRMLQAERDQALRLAEMRDRQVTLGADEIARLRAELLRCPHARLCCDVCRTCDECRPAIEKLKEMEHKP